MRHNQDLNKITFGETTLEWLLTVKYLGVIYDQKLLMKQNIENNIIKARKASGILYPQLKNFNSVPRQSKLTLYRSYIRPFSLTRAQFLPTLQKRTLKRYE